MIERRVNINTAALDARARIADPHPTPEGFPECDDTLLWEQSKPERNGLAAIIASAAFKRTFTARHSGERGPYGLLQIEQDRPTGYPKSDPVVVTGFPLPGLLEERGDGLYQNIYNFVKSFEKSIYSTASYDLRQEIDRRKELSDFDQERKEYDRLERLTTGFNDGIQKVYIEPAYQYLRRGAEAATNTIGTSIKTIDYHYFQHSGKHISGEELAEVLRNSTRLHQRFASGHLDTNGNALFNLIDRGTERFKEAVYLQGTPPRLDIPKDQWQFYRDSAKRETSKKKSNIVEQVITGCPALASTEIVKNETTSDEFTEAVPNVIQGMTSWAADILETL